MQRSWRPWDLAVLMGLLALTALLACESQPASLRTDPRPAPPGPFRIEPGVPIPELRGIVAWVNSEPLRIQDLRGKVVVIDFWTYTCVNCIRTLPYLREWHQKYGDRGLAIIGVHSPEFEFEQDLENVRAAVKRLGVLWPVAVDNEHATWRAYQNRFWPHKYLADGQGRLRFHHIGEGAYRETEEWVRKLLTEAGHDVSDIPLGKEAPSLGGGVPITREIYAGTSWSLGDYLGNPALALVQGMSEYADPRQRKAGRFYLHGRWEVGPEWVRPAQPPDASSPYIAIRYRAREVNAVLQPRRPAAFRVWVTLDDAPVPGPLAGEDLRYAEDGRSYLAVQDPRMYRIIAGPEVQEQELRLYPTSEEFQLYAYTFG